MGWEEQCAVMRMKRGGGPVVPRSSSKAIDQRKATGGGGCPNWAARRCARGPEGRSQQRSSKTRPAPGSRSSRWPPRSHSTRRGTCRSCLPLAKGWWWVGREDGDAVGCDWSRPAGWVAGRGRRRRGVRRGAGRRRGVVLSVSSMYESFVGGCVRFGLVMEMNESNGGVL